MKWIFGTVTTLGIGYVVWCAISTYFASLATPVMGQLDTLMSALTIL